MARALRTLLYNPAHSEYNPPGVYARARVCVCVCFCCVRAAVGDEPSFDKRIVERHRAATRRAAM